MLLKCEFSKHMNKFNILFISLLLIFNICMAAYQYRDEFTFMAKEIRESKQNLLGLYLTNENEYQKLYDDYLDRLSEYKTQNYMSFSSGDAKSIPVFVNVFINQPDYGDKQLFSDIEAVIKASDKHRQALNSLLRDASMRIKATENRDSYTYRYYIKLINLYDPFAEMSWKIADITGWNEFFSLQTPSFLLLLVSLGIFCSIFTVDRRAGLLNLLHISKKGGRNVTRAKLCYIAVTSASLTAVYTLLPLSVFMLSCGLSSAEIPVQALDNFTYCRFNLTVWQYLIIYVTIRIVIFICFSLFVAVIGQYAGNEMPAFVFTVLLAVSGAILREIDPVSKYYFLQKFSVIELTDINILFTKFRGLNVFNYCADYTYAVFVVLISLIIVISVISLIKKNLSYIIITKERKADNLSHGAMSLFAAEGYKLLVCEAGIWIIFAAVLLKCVLSVIYYRPNMNASEALYIEYIEKLQGPVTEEKLQYIEQEKDYIDGILNSYSEMQSSYQSGKISYEEYKSYTNRYNYANYCKNAFKRLYERRNYLIEVQKLHENVEFIYEEGIDRMLGVSIDIAVVMTTIFICGNTFSVEYDSGFSKILRLTKKGRVITFRTKTIFILLTAVLIYVVFSLIDIYNLLHYYDIDYLSANVISISRYAELNMNIDIFSYVILYKGISFAGYIICFLLIMSLSVILESHIKTMIISAIIIFIPFITEYYDISILRFMSLPYFMSPVYVSQSITYVVCIVLTAASMTKAYIKWIGRRYVR